VSDEVSVQRITDRRTLLRIYRLAYNLHVWLQQQGVTAHEGAGVLLLAYIALTKGAVPKATTAAALLSDLSKHVTEELDLTDDDGWLPEWPINET
jgi:hypothetical protein